MSRQYTPMKQYHEEMEQMHQEGCSCREMSNYQSFLFFTVRLSVDRKITK